MMKLLKNGHFWTVLGGVVAVLSMLFSAYQFYQSAQLNKRTLLGGYALEAHRSVQPPYVGPLFEMVSGTGGRMFSA